MDGAHCMLISLRDSLWILAVSLTASQTNFTFIVEVGKQAGLAQPKKRPMLANIGIYFIIRRSYWDFQRTLKFSHNSPVLKTLHLLKINERIKFKIPSSSYLKSSQN
jgi:hypothetical protein